MKAIFLWGLFALGLHQGANAQNWAEWFRQKKTQKKYLLQQIAALQVYVTYAKKGYAIAGKGINAARDIKNGDFALHKDFLASFEAVNPAVAAYAKVPGIIAYQTGIVKQAKAALSNIKQSGQFTAAEMKHGRNVLDRLLVEGAKTIDALIAVLTSGEMKMKDDERLRRIDALYVDSQAQFGFCHSFAKETRLLSIQRLHERAELDYSKILNSVK